MNLLPFKVIKIEETELSKEIAATKTGAPEPDSRCGWSEEECAKAESAALEEVEDLEERVFGASLQVKVREDAISKVTQSGFPLQRENRE